MLRLSRSAEPGRKTAYSVDLRWRVIYQRLAKELFFEAIAQNLSISRSRACRFYALLEATGDVEPSCHQKKKKKLDERTELYAVGLLLEGPTLFLDEVCQELQEALGISVSPPTVCRLLKSYGITRKKVRQIASQICDVLQGAFLAQCFMFTADKFVWIDESGSDTRNYTRKFGYSVRGTTPVSHRFFHRGKRTNAIAAISSTGLMALTLTHNTVNQDVFYDFVRGNLIPQMRPFDGISPATIAVMDNLSVHHVKEITDLFHQAGIVLFFLPPYSLKPSGSFQLCEVLFRDTTSFYKAFPTPQL